MSLGTAMWLVLTRGTGASVAWVTCMPRFLLMGLILQPCSPCQDDQNTCWWADATGPCGVPLSSLRLPFLFEPVFLFLFKICSPQDWGESKNQRLSREGFPGGSEGKASACNAGYLGLIPGLGRSLGEGHGNPLQYSFLENPMDRGAWQATVHGVTKSQTRLSY